MREKDGPHLNDDQIAEALGRRLDRVALRRDLWPSIRAEVQRRQSKPGRPWFLPPFGPLSVLADHVLAIRPTGLAFGSVAAALVLAWLLWSQLSNPEGLVLARHAGDYWYRSGESATVNAALSYDAFFSREGVNPFVDTGHNNFCRFAVDVDTASYTAARRLVMDGRLPDPDWSGWKISLTISRCSTSHRLSKHSPSKSRAALHSSEGRTTG